MMTMSAVDVMMILLVDWLPVPDLSALTPLFRETRCLAPLRGRRTKLDGIQIGVLQHKAETDGRSRPLAQLGTAFPGNHPLDLIAVDFVAVGQGESPQGHPLRIL